MGLTLLRKCSPDISMMTHFYFYRFFINIFLFSLSFSIKSSIPTANCILIRLIKSVTFAVFLGAKPLPPVMDKL